MKAAVIHGPGKVTCDTVDDPILKDDRDMILKVTATAICGSDLHIYSGGFPQPRPMVLGHEFMSLFPFLSPADNAFSATMIIPVIASIPTRSIMDLKEGCLRKKAEPCLGTLICMVDMMADRPNMSEYHMLIMVREKYRII
jgi:hypothetical protein